jgi:hypothetical protein
MRTRGTLPNDMTEAEPELVNSPLEREITINGTTVKIGDVPPAVDLS